MPKRAVDLAVDVKGASAPSWSSVNNCTASPPVDIPLDFSQTPTRAERRRILRRLHESTHVKQRKQPPPAPNAQHLEKREQLKEIFHDVSRLHLSEGEITWMMSGRKLKVGEQTFWSGSSGHLFRNRRKASTVLSRFEALAKKCMGKRSAQ